MSTTFDVYPSTGRVPSFAELLTVANGHLSAFLNHYGIGAQVCLSVGMRDSSDRVVAMTVADPVWWPDDHYAWFYVPGIAGGTDAYAYQLDDLEQNILVNDVAFRRGGIFAEVANEALKVGRRWCFRRSAGQPAIINIAYGMLAASLAQLTGGIIDSIDRAWDDKLLPAHPSEFVSWYFRPEMTQDRDNRLWAERCIERLSDELKPPPAEKPIAPPPSWWTRLLRRR